MVSCLKNAFFAKFREKFKNITNLLDNLDL